VSEVEFPHSPIPAANVASVPQRSPLRYPGGKTWLVPHIRAWLGSLEPKPRLLIEPFGGGAIVSLTAVMEGLVERCLLAELDPDVAAFWKAALHHGPNLCERIRAFEPTREAVEALARTQPDDVLERGFRALVLNRTRRGGILAPGASLSRAGESGKGLASRWYPETIVSRLERISAHADRIEFRETDGMRLLEEFAGEPGSVVFADPPWDISSKDVAGVLEKVSGLMSRGAVAVVTRRANDDVPVAAGLDIEDRRRHGDTEIIRYLKE